MKRYLVFCHGFDFDRSFWKYLDPHFSQENCTYLDLGYFGDKSELDLENKDIPIIGIVHSLGLPKLLSSNKKFERLIGLNGFVNFLGNHDELYRQRKREL